MRVAVGTKECWGKKVRGNVWGKKKMQLIPLFKKIFSFLKVWGRRERQGKVWARRKKRVPGVLGWKGKTALYRGGKREGESYRAAASVSLFQPRSCREGVNDLCCKKAGISPRNAGLVSGDVSLFNFTDRQLKKLLSLHQPFELLDKRLLHGGQLMLLHMDQDAIHLYLRVGDGNKTDTLGAAGVQTEAQTNIIGVR